MTKESDEESIHPSETAYDKAIKRMEEREACMPDMISLYHLSRRLNDDMDFGSSNLFELLVTDNSITRFLQRHGFAFEGVEGHVEFSYKNEKIFFQNSV